jgi:thiol:disulfide interchange protein DsbD
MKYMPKPGNWMITFKQFMGFLLVGTVVWLLWVLSGLLGASGVVWTVAFLAFAGLACWLYGKSQFSPMGARKVLAYAVALTVLLLGGWFTYGQYSPEETKPTVAVDSPKDLEGLIAAVNWSKSNVPWIPYSKGLPERIAASGHMVYVDYTARWCLTCQANKKLVFSSEEVRAAMDDLGVIPVKADYTRHDPAIAEDLRRFGRDGVPLNIIYPANRPHEPLELPIVLTPNLVLSKLNEAGTSTTG